MGLGDWLANAWDTVTSKVKGIGNDIKEGIVKAATAVADKADEAAEGAKEVVVTVYEDIKAGLAAAKDTVDGWADFFKGPIVWIGGGAALLVAFMLLKR